MSYLSKNFQNTILVGCLGVRQTRPDKLDQNRPSPWYSQIVWKEDGPAGLFLSWRWVLFYFNSRGISHLDSTSLVDFFGVVWVPGDCSQTEQGQKNTVVAKFDTEEHIGRLAQLTRYVRSTKLKVYQISSKMGRRTIVMFDGRVNLVKIWKQH